FCRDAPWKIDCHMMRVWFDADSCHGNDLIVRKFPERIKRYRQFPRFRIFFFDSSVFRNSAPDFSEVETRYCFYLIIVVLADETPSVGKLWIVLHFLDSPRVEWDDLNIRNGSYKGKPLYVKLILDLLEP